MNRVPYPSYGTGDDVGSVNGSLDATAVGEDDAGADGEGSALAVASVGGAVVGSDEVAAAGDAEGDGEA